MNIPSASENLLDALAQGTTDGIQLAINVGGLNSVTKLPGFPGDSYLDFSIAFPFIQGALFASINAGSAVARDVETGFLNRLALTPMVQDVHFPTPAALVAYYQTYFGPTIMTYRSIADDPERTALVTPPVTPPEITIFSSTDSVKRPIARAGRTTV